MTYRVELTDRAFRDLAILYEEKTRRGIQGSGPLV
jgi:hypothetical protein